MMNQNQYCIRLTTNRKAVAGTSPYRLTDARGNEIKQVNDYLDSLAVRGLSERTMRIYAYDLLNFWRWLMQTRICLLS